MLTIQQKAREGGAWQAELVLPYELRQKCRLRTRTTSGEEVGLFMPRGQSLRHGDILLADDGRRVRVTAMPETVLQIECCDALQLARIAYHLGNRHVPLQLGPGWLRIAADDVLRQMVEGLGGRAVPMQAQFEPEPGAYGSHAHAPPEAPAHRGIIHQYVSTP